MVITSYCVITFLVATCKFSTTLVENLMDDWRAFNQFIVQFRTFKNQKVKMNSKFRDLGDVHSQCKRFNVVLISELNNYYTQIKLDSLQVRI